MAEPPQIDRFPECSRDEDAGAAFVLESKGQWWHAGFHLTTAIVGPTILTLPYAFRGLGWGLGFLCLTVMGVVTFYSYYLMSLVLEHCEKDGRRHIRFRELAADVLGKMSLTLDGISITDQDGAFRWSTAPLKASVSALQLTEMGNLLLLDQFNVTLWESFRYPTDTIVIGQNLPLGLLLSSTVSSGDLSTGNYRLAVSASDALLQWQNLTYWKLSMDTKAYTNSNYAVEYMAINQTGLYLFGHNGSVVVIQVNLSPSEFRIAKLDYSGLGNSDVNHAISVHLYSS